jgi:hypothetical protein
VRTLVAFADFKSIDYFIKCGKFTIAALKPFAAKPFESLNRIDPESSVCQMLSEMRCFLRQLILHGFDIGGVQNFWLDTLAGLSQVAILMPLVSAVF